MELTLRPVTENRACETHRSGRTPRSSNPVVGLSSQFDDAIVRGVESEQFECDRDVAGEYPPPPFHTSSSARRSTFSRAEVSARNGWPGTADRAPGNPSHRVALDQRKWFGAPADRSKEKDGKRLSSPTSSGRSNYASRPCFVLLLHRILYAISGGSWYQDIKRKEL